MLLPDRLLEPATAGPAGAPLVIMPLSDFDGSMSAKRWLAKHKRELINMNLSPHDWIEEVWAQFTGDTVKWAANNKEIDTIVNKDDNTEEEKARFIELMIKKYPEKKDEEETLHEHEIKLNDIKQKDDESLKDYYERVSDLLVAAGGQDYTEGASLNSIEKLHLKGVVRRFVDGVKDAKLRKTAKTQYLQPLDSDIQGLKATWAALERCLANIKSEEAAEQNELDMASAAEYRVFTDLVKNMREGGPVKQSSITAMQATLATMGMTPEIWSSLNQRPRQPPRVRSNERVQDVTNLVDNNSAPYYANNGLRHFSGYSPQDPRSQQPPAALPAPPVVSNAMAPQYRTADRWAARNAKADAEFNPKTHSNSFINGSVIYDRNIHGALCFGCGGLDHLLWNCPIPEDQRLTPVARRYLKKDVLHYAPRYQQEEDLYALPPASAPSQVTASQPLPWQPAGTYNASQQNQWTTEPAKPASYSVGVLGNHPPADPCAPPPRLDRMWVPPKEGSDKTHARSNVVVAGKPTVEEITDSEEDYLVNGGSNSVIVSSGSPAKSRLLTNHLTASVKEARKRARIERGDSDSEDARPAVVQDSAKPKKKATRQRGKKKGLKPIAGMIGQPEINIADILLKQTITLPAMHLYQLSPWFRDEMKRVTNAPRKSRKKRSEDPEKEGAVVSSVALTKVSASGDRTIKWASKEYLSILDNSPTAFNVPAILSKNLDSGEHLGLPFGCAKADQGSDLVIINEQLAKALKLKFRSSRELDKEGVKMTVASGDNHALVYWVVVHINVEGIKRRIWAFVNPKYSSTHLLLGLPWLNSVEAKIDVKAQEIRIGSKAMMEDVKCISSPWLTTEQLRSSRINTMKQKESQQLDKTIKKLAITESSDDDSESSDNETNTESLSESSEESSDSDATEWEQAEGFH